MKQLLLICAVVALVGCGDRTKTCPECKETVKAGAKTCIHCHYDIAAHESVLVAAQKEEELRKQQALAQEKAFIEAVRLYEKGELPFDPRLPDGVVMKAIRRGFPGWNQSPHTFTKADFEKVPYLQFGGRGKELAELPKGLEKCTHLKTLGLEGNQLTDVKGLEKLTKLKTLFLHDNPDLTKAQIDELKKALPRCELSSDHD
jgi:hypothetical protein